MARSEQSVEYPNIPWKLIAGVFLLIVIAITIWVCVEITTIRGNEIGVKETWTGGVEQTCYPPRTYFLFPGYSQDMYRYSLSPQIFVMNNRKNDERANGRQNDAYVAKSSDNQTVTLELALQWHLDPDKVVKIHQLYHAHVGVKDWDQIIEERIIRQNLMLAVNTAITKRTAITSYSGEGFVATQSEIFNALTDPKGELRDQGIIIESFVIERISLDEAYIGEINKRQVAQQRQLRLVEEEKAAEREASKAKAEAQAEYERQVVSAKTEKEKEVLKSEGAAQQQINEARAASEKVRFAAEAEANRLVIAAKAEKEAGEARAAAILAIGKAESEAKRLQMTAYEGKGAELFAQIEISKQLAEAFKGIQGYLPSDMKINLLSQNFMDSLKGLMANKPVEQSKK